MNPWWLNRLPCTMAELAAAEGISTHAANGRLDYARKRGLVQRSQLFRKTRTRNAHMWVRT